MILAPEKQHPSFPGSVQCSSSNGVADPTFLTRIIVGGAYLKAN